MSSGVTAGTLSLTATNSEIGTASNPLQTSVGSLTVSGASLFLANNTALTVASANITGDVDITTIGSLALGNGTLGSTSSDVSLTATAGALTTTGNVSISANTLTVSAEQIGNSSAYSPAGTPATDVIQTDAAAIDATADYGGIYISNADIINSTAVPLTLTAAAVGPTPGSTATNNIEIYSAGSIVLLPQTSNLPGAGSTLVGIYNPGGTVTLVAGQTLSTGGNPNTATPAQPGDTMVLPATITNANGTVNAGPTWTSLGFAAQDQITVSGAANPANNGTFTIQSISTNGYTLTLTTSVLQPEADNNVITVTATGATTYNGQVTFPGFTVTDPTPPTGNYFDVYTGTLIIGNSQLTASGTLSGAGYGPLVTQTNTAEVAVFSPLAIANAGPLEISASALANGGTFTGSSITIVDLGKVPLTINGNLLLESTGAIVFLNPQNTILLGTNTMTVYAGSVAALGNIVTSGGNVTIIAAGSVGIGTVNAGSGTVSITSSGSIFNNNGGSLSITAGNTHLAQAQVQVYGQGNQSGGTAPQNTSLAQLELNYSQAVATAAAAARKWPRTKPQPMPSMLN